MFKPSQVLLGRGRQDEEDHRCALAVAKELSAASLWDGTGQVVVHFPASVLRRLEASPVERFDAAHRTPVHEGVRKLKRGDDYQVKPPPEQDPKNWRQLRLLK